MRVGPLLLVLVSSLALAGEPAPSAFAQLPVDPAPVEIVRGLHYWVSNENQFDLFHARVQGKKGLYLGVGSDQNYLLAAWARADTLVLLDFDQSIVDLHRVYRVLFRAADNPRDFLRLWSAGGREETRRLIEEGYPDPRARARSGPMASHARRWSAGCAAWRSAWARSPCRASSRMRPSTRTCAGCSWRSVSSWCAKISPPRAA